ncbi:MAG: CoA transferase, partial [Acidimicrobiales bacterium]
CLVRVPHPRLGTLTLVGPPVALSASAFRAGGTPPDLGADTVEVLEELGLDAATVAELVDEGVVVTAGVPT